MRTVEADDRGRLYLPKDLREKHGERFRLLDLPRRVILLPVDDDPLRAVRDAIGDRFEDRSLEDIEEDIETAAAAAVEERTQRRQTNRHE